MIACLDNLAACGRATRNRLYIPICFLFTFSLNQTGVAGEWVYEVDPYYSNVAYFQSIGDVDVPRLGKRTELEMYQDLLARAYRPQFFLIEASINPLPILGVALKDDGGDESIYDNMPISQNLNLVEAVTTGFEEPYAVSFFLGNRVEYQSAGEESNDSHGFIGYLWSYGHLHIRENQLVQDRWGEFEWKIKGEQVFSDRDLSWSFRFGFKIHDNPLITDEFYVGIRRERHQFNGDVFSWVQNGGIEFTYRVDRDSGKAIGQQLILDKKIPWARRGWVFSLGVGLVRNTRLKYKGELQLPSETTFVVRPSLEF
ncbi:hypothetical protein HF888_06240 [Bermanella marisrubri]|uniref:Uncharacterized protein n=1 Tax=Bermanella marisrubri TaxID=207949 RepID=Q1N0M0_9GAMM|nr:hypothetical protein [Bermanella marisrubri]EAT11813.1 hypothetical protein RED65_05484 [Oceanobacter sp. RED65] [Bermanella marisrubri]QIZ83847.1 hypothetical protein HF888_06240 [Bermanella marisrubri]